MQRICKTWKTLIKDPSYQPECVTLHMTKAKHSIGLRHLYSSRLRRLVIVREKPYFEDTLKELFPSRHLLNPRASHQVEQLVVDVVPTWRWTCSWSQWSNLKVLYLHFHSAYQLVGLADQFSWFYSIKVCIRELCLGCLHYCP